MAHKTITMKASELIEDFSIYPRNCVFDGHVYDLAESLRAGAVFPPVVADAKSKRITDGFHRRRSAIRVGGDDVEIEVQLVEYTGDADMVRDSMARNAVHGRRLTTADIARCAELSKKFKIKRDELADLLHITREKLTEICATRSATSSNGAVVLRRPMAHLAGHKLTKAQEAIVTHVGGHPAVHHVNVLIKLIESKSLPNNDRLFERLAKLHGLLEGMLVA